MITNQTHCAVRRQYEETVNALLAARANINTFQETVLHLATERKHPGMVNLLLAARADIDDVNQFQETVLHVAVVYKGTEVVQALLAAGAKTEILNKDQRTALHGAAFGETSRPSKCPSAVEQPLRLETVLTKRRYISPQETDI